MTISISGSASGTPDHKLEIIQNGAVRQVTDVPGAFSTSVWKGAPLVLREAGCPLGLPTFFKFALGQPATQIATGFKGTVVARNEHINVKPNTFCLRHVDGQGNEVDAWFAEDQLAGVEPAPVVEHRV